MGHATGDASSREELSREPQGSTSGSMLGRGSVCCRERQGGHQRRRLTERGKKQNCALPAEKGMKKSLFLKVPFLFKKCSGLNSCGFGNSLLSWRTELRMG